MREKVVELTKKKNKVRKLILTVDSLDERELRRGTSRKIGGMLGVNPRSIFFVECQTKEIKMMVLVSLPSRLGHGMTS